MFGDVHGKSDLLARLFTEAKSRYGACQFLTLGDLIDRGPDSRGVIELCVTEGVKGVYGNHELWLRDALEPGGIVPNGITGGVIGGLSTLSSYGVKSFMGHGQAEDLRENVPPSHKQFLADLNLILIIEAGGKNWYLVHAGVNAKLVETIVQMVGPLTGVTDESLLRALARGAPNSLLWSTSNVSGVNGGMHRFRDGIQVFGHTPVRQPIVTDHFVALDTGSGTCPPWGLSAFAVKSDGTTETFTIK
jgi:hypothetical protein